MEQGFNKLNNCRLALESVRTHSGYISNPLDSTHGRATLRLLSLSVFLALASFGYSQTSYSFPLETSFTQNGATHWSFGTDSGFDVSTGTADQKAQYTLLTGTKSDPFDNSEAWLWSYSTKADEPSSLSIVISDDQTWNSNSGTYTDHTTRTMWIAAGLISDFNAPIPGSVKDPKVILARKQYIADLDVAPSSGNYSKTANGNTLKVTIDPRITFMGKFFGARNDLGGGSGNIASNASVGDANNNVVDIFLGNEAKLYAKLIFGGRSAQLDAVKGKEVTLTDGDGNPVVTTTAVHKGFQTNNNKIWIAGTLSQNSAKDIVNEAPGDSSLLISKGIFGGEGYESNGNLVSIKDSLVVAGMPNARKLGLVGGRGNYYLRINQVNLGPNTNNSLVCDGDKLAEHSAIANNNIVTIDNSYIGYKVSKDKNDWDTYGEENLPSNGGWKGTNHAFSIYGGWSTGQAANNIVSIKNSVINGNVIGGLELQDRLSVSAGDLRELDANLVSLFNVKLAEGSAVYGTSSAEGSSTTPSTTDPVSRVDESSLKAVNRRRGVVYFAGENEVDSVYARYVHFGQYVDNSVLENNPNSERNISRDYYPTSDNYQNVLNDPNYFVKDSQALKRITSTNAEAVQYSMKLGDLVAKTYVINRTGFHSSLTSRDPSNVSEVTNGLHNFWVGAYANLVKSVDGDGALFNKDKQDLFKDKAKYVVNHSYGDGDSSKERDLSLLVHDDGMVYAYDPSGNTEGSVDLNAQHRPALMHNFRYHYDGLVLYTGVNTGLDSDDNEIIAVAISFGKIEQFRNQNKQNLNAFGNTFVGVFMEDNPRPFFKPSLENGFDSVSASDMTFEPTTVEGYAPFEITQGGRLVAHATYGFYKYLHFDGKDDLITEKDADGNPIPNGTFSGKVTQAGQSGGVGLKYWLKSVDLIDGETLVLMVRWEILIWERQTISGFKSDLHSRQV